MFNLKIEKNITFTGEVHGDLKRALLHNCDFFVLTSYQEGDSVSVKEALASGLPVLISKACHFNEIGPEMAGIICDTNIDNISEGLFKLATDSKLRTLMSKKAREIIKSKYQNEILMKTLEKEYLQLIKNYTK